MYNSFYNWRLHPHPSVCVSICSTKCLHVCVSVSRCQILRMCVLFRLLLVCVGKPNSNRALCLPRSAARPPAVPHRKLGGFGSKLHLVRGENAAFVFRAVFVACVQCQECVLWGVLALWSVFSLAWSTEGESSRACDRLFKGYYRFYLN